MRLFFISPRGKRASQPASPSPATSDLPCYRQREQQPRCSPANLAPQVPSGPPTAATELYPPGCAHAWTQPFPELCSVPGCTRLDLLYSARHATSTEGGVTPADLKLEILRVQLCVLSTFSPASGGMQAKRAPPCVPALLLEAKLSKPGVRLALSSDAALCPHLSCSTRENQMARPPEDAAGSSSRQEPKGEPRLFVL